jgi:hypothetical protein
MSDDRSDPSREVRLLSSESVGALRDALREYLDGTMADEQLQVALRDIAREARDRGVPPEKVLIALHQVWDELMAEQRIATRDERQKLLSRLVTLCVEHYFAVSLLVCACSAGVLRPMAS